MRWIYFFIIITVGIGFFLHSDFEIPQLSWVGHLPGDLIVRKEGIEIFFPLTSSFVFSSVLIFFFAALKRKSGA